MDQTAIGSVSDAQQGPATEVSTSGPVEQPKAEVPQKKPSETEAVAVENTEVLLLFVTCNDNYLGVRVICIMKLENKITFHTKVMLLFSVVHTTVMLVCKVITSSCLISQLNFTVLLVRLHYADSSL